MGVSTKSTSQLFFTAHHFWECCLANWVSTYLYMLSVNPLPFNSGFTCSLWGGEGWERGDSQTQNTGVPNQSTHWTNWACCVCSPSRVQTRAFLRTPAPVSFLGLQSLAAVCCVCLCVVVFVFLFSLDSQLHSLCSRSLFVWNACLFSSIAVVFCELLRLEERRGEWGGGQPKWRAYHHHQHGSSKQSWSSFSLLWQLHNAEQWDIWVLLLLLWNSRSIISQAPSKWRTDEQQDTPLPMPRTQFSLRLLPTTGTMTLALLSCFRSPHWSRNSSSSLSAPILSWNVPAASSRASSLISSLSLSPLNLDDNQQSNSLSPRGCSLAFFFFFVSNRWQEAAGEEEAEDCERNWIKWVSASSHDHNCCTFCKRLSSPEVGLKYSLFLSSIFEGGGEREVCAVLNCANAGMMGCCCCIVVWWAWAQTTPGECWRAVELATQSTTAGGATQTGRATDRAWQIAQSDSGETQ